MAWLADTLKVAMMIVLITPVAHAATPSRDLEGIKKKIDTEKRGLSQLQKKEGSVLQSLGAIDADLEKKTAELKQTTAKLTTVLSELQRKEKQAAQLRLSIRQRQALFAERAVALYRRLRGGKPGALTECTITWAGQPRNLRTRGVHANQVYAAVLATLRMVNASSVRRA